MINEVVLMGKVKNSNEYLKIDGKTYLMIQLTVEKPFRNNEGFFEYEVIECLLWKGEAERFLENECEWLSIKGRLILFENRMFVYAEKVKFLDYLLMNAKS